MKTCHQLPARAYFIGLCVAVLLIATSGAAIAQQQTPNSDDTVRVNTNLVQSAITVIDKNGHFVDGLQREQFELLVDGTPRPISFFERVAAGSIREQELTAANQNAVESNAKPAAAVATVPGRTIVFFIDDLHLSPSSLNRTRQMLQRFLDNDMSPRDNIAIVSASGMVGFLGQFTNNKTVLEAAVGRLSPRQYDAEGYSVGTGAKMSEFMALAVDTGRGNDKVITVYVDECMKGASTFKKTASFVRAAIRASCETQVRNSARAILMQSAQITQNTYNSLASLISSSARAPGRKLAFFVSDGFLLEAGPHAGAVRDKLDNVIDAAQRAGVVIYTVHAEGLVDTGFYDPGNKRPMDGNGRLDMAAVGELEARQDALNALAADTGGRALRNTNYFDRWVNTVLDETSNYYMVAWRPDKDEETLKKFRNVKISVIGRPELSVRAPRGYVEGPATAAIAAAGEKRAANSPPKTPEAQIRDALVDYYPASGLPTLLSLTYLSTPANGPVVTSSIQIANRAVAYDNDGKQPAMITLAGVVLNDKGKVAASFKTQLRIKPPAAGASDGGIFYSHHTPLAPGIYQVRVAARDEKSGRVGSALQWIVVPDLSKSQLTVSSLLLGGQLIEDAQTKAANPQVQLSVDRKFPAASKLAYWAFVYNAKRDSGGNPHVVVQTQVLRNGSILMSHQRKVDGGGPDPERIPFGEELALNTLTSGRYDLRVTITDSVAGTSVTQLADFTVR